MSSDTRELWTAVDELIDRVDDFHALRIHKLQLLAAAHRRAAGRPVPPDVLAEERLASLRTVLAPIALERVRNTLTGPIILFKGPEVAARYPDRRLRPFNDLDILVPDADEAHRRLVQAGFVERDDPIWAFRGGNEDLYADKHHSRPLELPDVPIRLEVHRRPSWPWWLELPPLTDLWERAIPSSIAPKGVLTLSPADHALVLAAHAWVGALTTIRDLVDILAIAEGDVREQATEFAHEWGMSRIWQSTLKIADAVLLGQPLTPGLRVWTGNLAAARDRTVFEVKLARWLLPFAALPARRATIVAAARFTRTFKPAANEPWRDKLRRIRRAIVHARIDKEEHDRSLGPEARQLPRR